MNKRGLFARTAAGAFGGMLLIGVAGAAIADEVGNDQVDVNVNIEAVEPVGALTMSVANDSTSLTEVTAADDTEFREFTGTLPTVTVTDDREEVPAGVFWYVNGQSSDFTATGGLTIGAENLGWTPALVTEGDGEVAAGDGTVPELDEPTAPGNNVGLAGAELLALTLDSNEARTVGSWSADADLKLKTAADVEPGSYSATITLTLWEDAY
ncbi:hypothetical protein [Microbacterium flavescens]|jgi:hypothetical protein|uniref:hypothetical protein n=1 Tax=Microbacterium flavescens TaxID=69366 RepID=UPI001BDF5DD2|nr:hypothetical protein [Microbacterium flavescens]BFF10149.1 hypothetical protein GCM10025699_14520 [Microbacterium flavescens]